MLDGPQSTYVWIFCCTNEIYKYQALIEAIGTNVDQKWRFFSAFIIMLRQREAATRCGDHQMDNFTAR